MDFITTLDGCRIAYRWDGPQDAPVLLLSNSLGTDHAMWEPQISGLAVRFRVLRYDQRGHGRSDAPAGAYSMDRLGHDALDLLDALGIAKADFCGLSLGGMVGQWLAVHAPERIGKLILANTSAYMGLPANWQSRIDSVREQGMAPLAQASIARWFTPGFADRMPDAMAPIHAMLLATDPVGYAGCCGAIRDMDQRPTSFLNTLPTLVIAGAQDPATPVAASEFLAERARHGRIEILADAAHLSNVEQPEAFLKSMLAFLA
ncbi:3-oxoadipate enol-lactonase [Novosphingobium rosa]|uniref:3-oxoadipate enol-lactonase n=1 Tax=Novosphingobium rosa TaxID=76978 RepID=UPI000833E4DB|nr:3-oxoadipate enol-lactonase [Novosphingobium rosa]